MLQCMKNLIKRKLLMAIKPPSWCKTAVPTPQGWRDPRTNELLKAMKISQGDIDAFHGKVDIVEAPVVYQEPAIQQLNEAPANDKSIYEMTKFELESLGRQYGIELDRRKSKSDLIEEMEEIIELNEQYS